MSRFNEQIAAFGADCKAKLSGPGEREAGIRAPFNNLMVAIGQSADLQVVPHDEVRDEDGTSRPDYAISVNGAIVGFVELKAPGVSLDPSTYGKSTHNYRQWQRLKDIPNLLHTDGTQWRLWRSGELVYDPVHLTGLSLMQNGPKMSAVSGTVLRGNHQFDAMVLDFLRWKPTTISSVSKLVETIAPLAVALRAEVLATLKSERRAVASGRDRDRMPFLGAQSSWNRLLFPGATDEKFADGYAQTVTFALLLARVDGIDLETNSLHEISKKLDASHSLMGRALDLLTEYSQGPVKTLVQLIVRVMSAVQWDNIKAKSSDLYLHLYEHFLDVYDPELRKESGSYYTPVEIVDEMVRLTEDVLAQQFGRTNKFRDPAVTLLDGSMGTGTFPLSVLRRAAIQASEIYGPGAAPEALTNLASRMYGIELQSGPFSVAELRMTDLMKTNKAKLPDNGLNLYVANTLEDPASAGSSELGYSEKLIAAQRQKAMAMMRTKNIQVVISNPPYMVNSEGLGGWVEKGPVGANPKKVVTLLDGFKLPGNGLTEYVLKNLYVYFWRWAFWKVFESTNDPDELGGDSGIVTYITATGYLRGQGFKGMRKYIRETCSHGWIIDLTPEGKQPPAHTAVFNIETPVAIAIFVRHGGSQEQKSTPADIKYIALHGSKEQKFDQLHALNFSDGVPAENSVSDIAVGKMNKLLGIPLPWKNVRTDWTAPFTPRAEGDWDTYPAMSDFFPWTAPGIKPNRTWVYGTNPQVVEERLRVLVAETDMSKKKALFRESASATLSAGKAPLVGIDTEKNTRTPFKDENILAEPAIVRVGFRSFDRQWIVADSRLLHRASPDLWEARFPGQLFFTEQHDQVLGAGTALTATHLIPDMHHFNGRGGRVLPLFHPSGVANVAPGLLEALTALFGKTITAADLAAYVAGIAGHPGYFDKFSEELVTPGLRIPMTRSHDIWSKIVEIGERVLWLQTYGNFGSGTGQEAEPDVLTQEMPEGFERPRYLKTVGEMPETKSYDSPTGILSIGGGEFGPIHPHVISYSTGGRNVVDSWFSYRKKEPGGRRTSPLDDLNVQAWDSDWSRELMELLVVLTHLVALEPLQKKLLDDVLSSELISMDDLNAEGVAWPTNRADRKPRKGIVPTLGNEGMLDFS